jgi:hypothetical protein
MAMQNDKIDRLNPNAIYRGFTWLERPESRAEGVRERFHRFYAGMREEGAVDYDLDRIGSAIFYLRLLLARKGLTGASKTALEIGSGAGAKSISLAGLFGTYIGIEINVEHVSQANARNQRFGSTEIRFIAGNAADVLQNRREHDIPDRIDVLILYAVLEHLTLNERRVAIRFADEVMCAGGSVLVMESPNRLIPHDGHTTGLQFFNWLPDEMANTLARHRANNPEVRGMLREWHEPDAVTMLARAGRGVSFHDFEEELSKPLSQYSFDADGFDVEMLNMQPFPYQEFSLLGYLVANVAEVPAMAFSRFWLDFIVSRRKPTTTKKFLSPFWPNWASFDQEPVFWHPVGVPLSEWLCEIPEATVRDLTLVFTAPEGKGRLSVSLDSGPHDEIDVEALVQAKPDTWHQGHSVCISVQRTVSSLRIEADAAKGPVLFQGAVASVGR